MNPRLPSPPLSLLLCCAALLGGPAARAAEPTRILLLRPPAAAMAGMTAEIQVDNMPLLRLGPRGCAVLEVRPGLRQVRYRWRADALGNPQLDTEFTALSVAVPVGTTAHLRLTAQTEAAVGVRGVLNSTTTWRLEQVSAADLLPHMAQCRPADAASAARP